MPQISTSFQYPIIFLVLHRITEHKYAASVKLIIHEANDATGCFLGLALNLAQLALIVELTLHNAVRANDADNGERLEKSQLCLDL